MEAPTNFWLDPSRPQGFYLRAGTKHLGWYSTASSTFSIFYIFPDVGAKRVYNVKPELKYLVLLYKLFI